MTFIACFVGFSHLLVVVHHKPKYSTIIAKSPKMLMHTRGASKKEYLRKLAITYLMVLVSAGVTDRNQFVLW